MEHALQGRDTTNVAARVEGMTKERGGGLLLSGSTHALLDGAGHDLEPAGKVEVRGRAAPVELWALPGAPVAGLRAA